MKKDYLVKKNVDRVERGGFSDFLDPLNMRCVLSKLGGVDYEIYRPFLESERNIIYVFDEPDVCLIEIICNSELNHREIMGSIYSLNIDDGMFGDIVITNGHYYVFIFRRYLDIFFNDLNSVGGNRVRIKEVPLDILSNYRRVYERIEMIVSSFRVDSIVSKIIHKNRVRVRDVLRKDNVFVNYEVCIKSDYILKIGDIFSVRGFGKYKLNRVVKETKKGNYILEILKYTDG